MKQGITTKHSMIWNASRATHRGCRHVVNPPMGKRVKKSAPSNHERVVAGRAKRMRISVKAYREQYS